jgi:hypothetical protein
MAYAPCVVLAVDAVRLPRVCMGMMNSQLYSMVIDGIQE